MSFGRQSTDRASNEAREEEFRRRHTNDLRPRVEQASWPQQPGETHEQWVERMTVEGQWLAVAYPPTAAYHAEFMRQHTNDLAATAEQPSMDQQPGETYDQWAGRMAQGIVDETPINEVRRAAGLPRAEQRSGTADEELSLPRPQRRAYESHDEWVRREASTAEQPSGTDPVGEASWLAARMAEKEAEAERRARFEQQLHDAIHQEGPMEPSQFAYTPDAPVAVREKTPNEIRRDEVAALLDFVQGDPIDGAPGKKAIIAGIKFRLGELTSNSAEEPMPGIGDQTKAEGLPDISGLIATMESITANLKAEDVRNDKRHAIDRGMEILNLDQDRPPADRLVAEGWRTNLATGIAVALVEFLSTE